MRIDLHMHSTFSDGVFTPAELIGKAVEADVSVISLTDHDCLDGLPEAMEVGRSKGVEVVSGVELSCEYRGRDLHVLGYGIDPQHQSLQEALHKFRQTRHKRGIKIIEKLNALGVTIDTAEVLAKAGEGALGRPHIAAVLVDKGVVAKPNEAFDKYLAEGGPAYVAKYKMSTHEAIDHIRGAGGLAFIAHPGIFLENINELLDLIAEGFDGVEVYHPTHSNSKSEKLRTIAEEKGLLVSGGTDFHGFAGRDITIGSQNVPSDVWEKLRDKLNKREQ